MRQIRFVTLLLLAACLLSAQNPDDVNFTLRLIKDRPEYAVDEPITFEISFSSSTDHKYYASWTSLGPYGEVNISLEPKGGAVDLRAFQNGFAGSILGSAGYLSDAPVKETSDLTDWYRFEKPGHFRMTVAVDWVSRPEAADERDGKEKLRVQSNTVEFDILPPDPAWEAEELESILREIDQRTRQGMQPGLHRLDLLQTPAAAREELRRYLAGAHEAYNPYAHLLQDSSELEEIIPLLQQALTNPSVDPPPGIVELLTELQIRKLAGQSAQPKNRQEDLLEQNNRTLLATIRLRSGPERLSAEFEAWSNAERHYTPTDPAPPLLNNLRADILSGLADLSEENQWHFLITLWDKLPHSELLPTVKRLARTKLTAGSLRDEAFKLWCEDSLSDCAEAMLEDVRQGRPELNSSTILVLPERERPDLDALLQTRLRDPHLLQSREGGLATAALILRAGSKRIQPGVEAFLDTPSASYSRNCIFDGYLAWISISSLSGEGCNPASNLVAKSEPEIVRWRGTQIPAPSRQLTACSPDRGCRAKQRESHDGRERGAFSGRVWTSVRTRRLIKPATGAPDGMARWGGRNPLRPSL